MSNLIQRIKTKMFFGMGVDKLNKEFLQFSKMHLAYLLATSITLTFVNTLLMRVSTDTTGITLKYSIVHFAFVGLSMTWAAMFMRKFNSKIIILIGVGLSMFTYLLTFIFMSNLDEVYAIVAFAHGVATGFYWITFFNSILIYTEDDTRDIAMSFLGVFSGIISLVMPLVSGYIIKNMSGLIGYYLVFGICFIVAGYAVYLVTKLPVIEPMKTKTKFIKLLKNIYTKKVWFYVIHMDFFKGIREGAFAFFLNVLLFKIASSETLVGVNTFLVGIMFISITLLTMLTSILFLRLDTMTILALSLANAFLGYFAVNPATTTMYTVLEKVPDGKELKTEVISITECYKNVGRILGVLLIMILPKTNFYYVVSLVVLTLTQYITVLFANTTLKHANKYETQV